MAALGEVQGPGVPGRVILQQVGVVHLEQADAGPRWRHHVIEAFEAGDRPLRQVPGEVVRTTVERRLAAAGLGFGHLDHAAGLLQQLGGGEADTGTVEVHQAGGE
ncbi:hypothetical protein D9M71_737490 [compost metagenome]